MSRIRAGVVGVGYLGRFHAQKYAANPKAELVGVVDSDPKRAAEVGRELGVRVFPNHLELLDRVEAVSVVTPAVSHHALAREALKAGAHCLLEKPMTETLDQADELIALAADRSLILQIGLLERFNPAVAALFDLVGKPRYIETRRLTPFVGRGTDIDVILELMIHDLDIILSLVREDPAQVRAVGAPLISGKLDMANVYLEFPSGCVANMTASRVSSDPCRRIDILQEEGRLSVDCAGRTLTVHSRKRDRNAEEVLPGIFATRQTFDPLPGQVSDPLGLEVDGFLDCITAETAPLVDGRAGRRALALALRISRRIVGGQA